MADEIDIEAFEFDANQAKEGDPAEARARTELGKFFEEQNEAVFFSRQIEILFEGRFFHWITARALRNLVEAGRVSREVRAIPSTGGAIHLFWNRRYRYYRRAADEVVRLVSEYAHPNVAAAIGIHGEGMVLGGFADSEFVLKARETSEYQGRRWTRTNHDLDFIFERDDLAYGVEVKNTLGYPAHEEISIKVMMAKFMRVTPVFVARMLAKTVINEIWKAGGFALILKYQLYPYSHRELAKRVAEELRLPVDSPRRLSDGTMKRFTDWHSKRRTSR
jgi:hypothetical protein